ncbi:hypothetical protein BGZ60DRAFT_397058 [Tricladium varicosporioides]|nr:hypothetical protein BGZ60DRAFT_397058 [Hymenoscyphus varicosporioides]
MAFNKLPLETMHNIVAHVPNIACLRNLCLTSRALQDVSRAALYRDINLFVDEYHLDGELMTTGCLERQTKLLKNIAEDSKIGHCVRSFTNHPITCRTFRDATLAPQAEQSLLIAAAKNMINLNKALLTPNTLAAEIVANLQSYQKLQNLQIYDLNPKEHIWAFAPTTLKHLKWQVPPLAPGYPPMEEGSTYSLLKMVQATCLSLESFDISLGQRFRYTHRLEALSSQVKNAQLQYRKLAGELPDILPMKNLKHFGLQNSYGLFGDYTVFLDFIKQHHTTLESITIPIGHHFESRESLNFILSITSMLPNLKELSFDTSGPSGPLTEIDIEDFLRELTSHPSTANIEKFSCKDIHAEFTAEIGEKFQAWTKLKFLQIGDIDDEESAYIEDGRVLFDLYKPDIVAFIAHLPPSLTHLYLEINKRDATVDDDSDFDIMCDFGPLIFKSLPLLHTCDVHVWMSNIDGGLGQLPEKGVFYRRLPHISSSNQISDGKKKDVWTSRYDTVYQQDYSFVSKKCETVEVEDGEGGFVGEDAEEVWLGGFEFDCENYESKWEAEGVDRSWPNWMGEKVAGYEMFRSRYVE